MAQKGRMVLCPGGPDARIFVNLLKNASSWVGTPASTPWPRYVGTDGYPTKQPTGLTLSCSSQSIPLSSTKQYVFAFTGSVGTGAYGVGINFNTASGAADPAIINAVTGGAEALLSANGYTIYIRGSDGSVRFTPNDTTDFLQLVVYAVGTNNGGGAVTELNGITQGGTAAGVSWAIYDYDDEAAFLDGDVFQPGYIDFLKELNPPIMRTGLAWTIPNAQFRSKVSMFWPANALSFIARQFIPAHWAGGAGSAGAFTSGGIYGRAGVNFGALAYDAMPAQLTQGEVVQGLVSAINVSLVINSISIASPGVFNITAHGLLPGTPIPIRGTGALMPAPLKNNRIVWVKDVINNDTFTVSATPGGPAIDITAAGTANALYFVGPTIDVGGRGPKPICAQNTMNLISTGAMPSTAPVSLIYDEVCNDGCWMLYAGGLEGGFPIARQAELCNIVGSDVWLCLPHLIALSRTETEAFADLALASLDADKTVWMQLSNEFWNFFFLQTIWGYARAVELGWNKDYLAVYAYYGQLSAQAGTWIKQHLAGTPNAQRFKWGVDCNVVESLTLMKTVRYGGSLCRTDANGRFTSGTHSAHISGSFNTNGTLTVTATDAPVVPGMMIGENTVGFTPGTKQILDYGNPDNRTGGVTTYVYGPTPPPGAPLVGTATLIPGGSGLPVVTNFADSPNRPGEIADFHAESNYYRGPNMMTLGGANDVWATRQTSSSRNILSISRTNPVVVETAAPHGYSTGNRCFLDANVGGMIELQNFWTTITVIDATKFSCSDGYNIVDATLTYSARSADATNYTPYTSGGTVRRIVPGINDGHVNAALNYASGDPVLMDQALQWASNDTRTGFREAFGDGRMMNTGNIQGYDEDFFLKFENLSLYCGGRDVIEYEGAADAYYMTAVSAARIGQDPVTFPTKSLNFVKAYKLSDYALFDLQLLTRMFHKRAHSKYLAWSGDADDSPNVGFMWAYIFGTRGVHTPYATYRASVLYGRRQRRRKLVLT